MASKAKRKTIICAVKYPNGAVIAETEYDRNLLKSLPIGSAVKIIPFANNRNYQHHKKLFSLLEIGFEYWQPELKVISDSEDWAFYTPLKMLAQSSNIDFDAIKVFADQCRNELKQHRENKLDYEGMKTLEGYLNHVMLKAGFYDIKPAISGGTFKERWSIAFDNMSQEIFNEVYKGVYGVIWNETLCSVYESEWQLDNKINQLMGFY